MQGIAAGYTVAGGVSRNYCAGTEADIVIVLDSYTEQRYRYTTQYRYEGVSRARQQMYYLTDPQTSWDVRRGLFRAVRLGVLERREVTLINLMEGNWNGIFGIRGSVVEEMGLIYEVQQEENLHHEQWEELNQEEVEESEELVGDE